MKTCKYIMEYGFFTEEIIREKVPAVHMHLSFYQLFIMRRKKLQKRLPILL
jgi:hypothetical protein